MASIPFGMGQLALAGAEAAFNIYATQKMAEYNQMTSYVQAVGQYGNKAADAVVRVSS